MKRKALFQITITCLLAMASSSLLAQQTSVIDELYNMKLQVENLKKKVSDLESELSQQKEATQPTQSKVTVVEPSLVRNEEFLGQKSRGFIGLGFGITKFGPDDIEELNEDIVRELNYDANWENFNVGMFFEVEIGKKLFLSEGNYLNISLGYQSWKAKSVEGTFNVSSTVYDFKEEVEANSVFIRFSYLREILNGHRIGVGFTGGYTPNAEMTFSLSEDGSGTTINASGEGALFEFFGIYELALSQHFSVALKGGYRAHGIENVNFYSSNIFDNTSRIDLDMSGLYSSFVLMMNI